MDEPTLALTAVTGTLGLVLLGLLVWGLRSGQFRNVEEAKYQVFADLDVGESPSDGATTEDTMEETTDAGS
jgi:nitrogen fixation-related uncharacterized protein